MRDKISSRQSVKRMLSQSVSTYPFSYKAPIEIRYQIEKMLSDCFEMYQTLKSQLRQKRKQYKDEELKNKSDRLERINDNLEVLRDMFNDQNAFEQGKLGIKVFTQADIEN